MDLFHFLKNTGDGTFQAFKDLKPGFTLSAIHGKDIDHNGQVDLAVTSLYGDTVRVLLPAGTRRISYARPNEGRICARWG